MLPRTVMSLVPVIAVPHVHPHTSGHASNLAFFLIVGIPVGFLVVVGLAVLVFRRR